MAKKETTGKQGIYTIVGDVAKKLITVSSDTKIVKDAVVQVMDLKNLSKDLAEILVDKIAKQKNVIVGALGNEFWKFLNKINVSEEVQKALDGMTIDFQAQIKFTKGKKTSAHKTSSKTSTHSVSKKTSQKKSKLKKTKK